MTHLPWCMSGSLTRSSRENVPGIPDACATRNFAYLVGVPWEVIDSITHDKMCVSQGWLVCRVGHSWSCQDRGWLNSLRTALPTAALPKSWSCTPGQCRDDQGKIMRFCCVRCVGVNDECINYLLWGMSGELPPCICPTNEIPIKFQIWKIKKCFIIQSSAVTMWSNMILHMVLRKQQQNRNQTSDSQQTRQTSPSRVSYGVSIMRNLKKIDRVITAPHCICCHICPITMKFCTSWTAILSWYV